MQFINHSNLEGTHAPYSPSQSSWLRYDEEQLTTVHRNKKAAERGTILHAWAKETIDLGIKQQRSNKTICAYVNDAIGFKMQTEVILYYSDNIYGTADAISFRNGVLRIHDLKTGVKPAKMEQLEIYAALFCLEYKVKPSDIEIKLRIYQNDTFEEHEPSPEAIVSIMNTIIHHDQIVEKIEQEEV